MTTVAPPIDYVFEDAEVPDTIPPTTDVEYPCEVCGRESGPYGGRGRKPKRCAEHKKSPTRSSVKVTGAPANLAAQAAGVLEQLNGIMAVACMAMGFNGTASAIAAHNDTFKEQAHQALLTDPDLCRLILKGGVKSAKVSLGLAYVGLGIAVIPVANEEMKMKKAAKAAQREAEDATGS